MSLALLVSLIKHTHAQTLTNILVMFQMLRIPKLSHFTAHADIASLWAALMHRPLVNRVEHVCIHTAEQQQPPPFFLF